MKEGNRSIREQRFIPNEKGKLIALTFEWKIGSLTNADMATKLGQRGYDKRGETDMIMTFFGPSRYLFHYLFRPERTNIELLCGRFGSGIKDLKV